MRFAILGPLEVYNGTQPVSIGGGRQRKLLGFLLVHANEAVASDRLIDVLWGGRPPETAAKALQGLVSQLRKQLGSESLETVAGGYVLRVAAGATDVAQLEALLEEARRLDRAPAAAKLREALALWRGPTLADFAYDDFARSESDRLERLRETCIERRIDLDLALGHHDDLVPELEALVRAYPLRERLRRHLMLALYQSGRQADALQAYQDARTILRDDLGLDPSDELQTLQRMILAHDPALVAPPRVEPPRIDAPRVEAQAGSSAAPPPSAEGRPDALPALPAVPSRRSHRRTAPLAVLGAVVLAAGAVAVALEVGGGGRAAPVRVMPNSVALLDARRNRVLSDTDVGRRPVSLAVGSGGVWVANADEGTVDRLDPTTGKHVQTIGVGTDLYGIATGFGSVWVAGGNDGTVTRIDPRLGQIQDTLTLGEQASLAPTPVFFVATDDRYVWVTRGDALLRIDPSTDQVSGRKTVGAATSLVTGAGSVFVTTVSERLFRFDARSLRLTADPVLPAAAVAGVFGAGSLWLTAGFGTGEADRIDPVTLTPEAYETTVTHPLVLAVGGGSLWVGNAAGTLERIDIRTGKAVATLHAGGGVSSVAPDGDRVWVSVVGAT